MCRRRTATPASERRSREFLSKLHRSYRALPRKFPLDISLNYSFAIYSGDDEAIGKIPRYYNTLVRAGVLLRVVGYR